MSGARDGLVGQVAEGARRLTGRTRPSLNEQLADLATVVESGRGRLPDVLLDRAEAVTARSSERLALSGDLTVVALAGATGSGKSSTFNAIAGSDVAEVGVRRPTTSVTTALVVGEQDGAGALLDWLDVRRRHSAPASGALDGLVLLDLPDHDSTEVAHHLEVDRLVAMVDLMVWVVDPQKYADAALHERYLRRLVSHAGVMLVVLNHVDEVSPAQRAPMLADLRKLLGADGLGDVPVVATSARTGEGLDDLRRAVAERVRDKRAAAARLTADVAAVTADLRAVSGDADPGRLDRDTRTGLVDALCDAAGVPTVVQAVERSVARRGSRHTGWPVTRWLSRLRPDPLARLHLDLGPEGRTLTALGRASVPEATPVQRARADGAVRAVAERVGAPLARPWADAVRRASLRHVDDLGDALDRAVVGTDLGAARVPLWWRVAGLLQGLLALATLAGALWLLADLAAAYLQLPMPEAPERAGLPLPTALLLAGVAGGLALALVGRMVNRLVARSRARAARRRLRTAVGDVADRTVLAAVGDEVAAYDRTRAALARLP